LRNREKLGGGTKWSKVAQVNRELGGNIWGIYGKKRHPREKVSVRKRPSSAEEHSVSKGESQLGPAHKKGKKVGGMKKTEATGQKGAGEKKKGSDSFQMPRKAGCERRKTKFPWGIEW